jgi:hypothetical protein
MAAKTVKTPRRKLIFFTKVSNLFGEILHRLYSMNSEIIVS